MRKATVLTTEMAADAESLYSVMRHGRKEVDMYDGNIFYFFHDRGFSFAGTGLSGTDHGDRERNRKEMLALAGVCLDEN